MESHSPFTATAEIPVFPLSQMVLFPGIVLPLRLHRPEDRCLVEDALGEGGYMAVALIQQSDSGVQHLARFGCAGLIVAAKQDSTGAYDILVRGTDRIRIVEEVPCNKPYGRYRVRIVSRPTPSLLHNARPHLLRLQNYVASYTQMVAAKDPQLADVMCSTADPLALVDVLGAVLVKDPKAQQCLLEGDLLSRVEYVIETIAQNILALGAPPAPARFN